MFWYQQALQIFKIPNFLSHFGILTCNSCIMKICWHFTTNFLTFECLSQFSAFLFSEKSLKQSKIFWHFEPKFFLKFTWDENLKPTNDPIRFRVTGQSLKLTLQLYGDKKRPKRIQNGTCWCRSMRYNCRTGMHRPESDRESARYFLIELSERLGWLRGSLI